jgi:hypothetical protein
MIANGFDAVGEQEGLLREITLDLGSQRRFPGAAQVEIKNNGSYGYHHDKSSQQLEENAILHFGASKR